MSTPPSSGLTQSSSESESYHSLSSHRSSLSNSLAGAFRTRGQRSVNIDASVYDQSHDNTWINQGGQMNVVHGNNAIQNIQVGLESADILVFSMARSKNAEFDIVGKIPRETCTPQTCQHILKDLKRWCKKKVVHLLFWLNGMPGTGKTTIVFTLCHYLRKRGLLGASFFCTRTMSDCQDVMYIFPTIAFQLAKNYPGFRKELGNVLQQDPDIPRKSLHVQLQRLIIEPSKAQEKVLPSGLVVVLDALDECQGNVEPFLQVLVQYTSRLPFRFLLTSRPEHEIHSVFESSSLSPVAEKYVLHEVEKSIVKEDIVKFLQTKLLPLPDAATIDTLADYSGSSFILAATVVRLVMDKEASPLGRSKRLGSILNVLQSRAASVVTKPIDTAYTEILSRVTESRDELFEEEIQGIKDIVFTIICVREPLTREAIGLLWGLSGDEVEQRLKQLHSVIFVPEDVGKPITVFHASFIDYITDKNRSQGWYCDEMVFHDKLAAMCFKTMNEQLRQNICELEGEVCRPNKDIGRDIVEKYIGVGLGYACENWAEHLQRCRTLMGYSSAVEAAHEFVKDHLLHWFECTSLLGCFFVCEGALEELEEWLKGLATAELVQEGREFLRLNYDVIDYSANETYRSALVWTPTTSSLRTHYVEAWRQVQLPRALHGLATDWAEASRAVKTHTGSVNTVAITSDGSRVVFGSEDATVHLWNVVSQKEDQTLTGHTAGIKSVAVSSTGSHLISASRDGTARVWELGHPEPITVFRGHSDVVQSAAVSPDGMLVCSCDLRGNIMAWGLLTAQVQWSRKTAQPDARNRTVSFLSTGDHLVSVSRTVVQIWNSKTGAVIRSFKGHASIIKTIAVSSDDTLLITGSADKTARIWNTSSGKTVRTLHGHTDEVLSAAFFHDGQRAVTGSGDKTIRIWDVSNGDSLALLTGHTQFVCSVAVFPDDTRVVSGSWDGTLMFWNIPKHSNRVERRWIPWSKKAPDEYTDVWKGRFMASSRTLLCLYLDKKVHLLDTATLEQRLTINVGTITSAAFSTQGPRFAAALDTVTIWDVSNGRKLVTMKGHQHPISSIAFSHDDKRIATGSDDGTARIWCANTGTAQRVLQHPSIIHSVSFSSDDRLIATSSDSKTMVRIWDSRTGNSIDEPQLGLDLWVNSAVFSPDGRYLIISLFPRFATLVWDIRNGQLAQSFSGHRDWTCLPSGTSYSIFDSSWICKSLDPATPPTKLYWIPPKYRLMDDRYNRWRPIAFSSSYGDRILLTSANSTVVLDLSTS